MSHDNPDVLEILQSERLPDYPLWWETLPENTFTRLKNEWRQNHEQQRS